MVGEAIRLGVSRITIAELLLSSRENRLNG